MRVAARHADIADLESLMSLYRVLEEEMVALHPMWPLADGLDAPVEDSLVEAIVNPETIMLVGTIDDSPLGFLLARTESMHSQAGGEEIGSIRLIFVDHDAREVAVGEEMRDMAMGLFRERNITKFDAHVLPGHRLTKNFFEAGGFSARSIIMHHDDNSK